MSFDNFKNEDNRVALAMDLKNVERRYEAYKNDSFIKGCQNQITKILSLATPHIEVDLSTFEKIKFDIDSKSKEQVEWWLAKVKEYTETEYSDIIQKEK